MAGASTIASTPVLGNAKRSGRDRLRKVAGNNDEMLRRALLQLSNGSVDDGQVSRQGATKYLWATPHSPLQTAFFVACDALSSIGCIMAGLRISDLVFGSHTLPNEGIQSGIIIGYTGLLLFACDYFGLYSRRQKPAPGQILRITAAVLLAAWCTGLFWYASGQSPSLYVAMAEIAGLTLLVQVGWRLLRLIWMNHRVAHGCQDNRVALILGAGSTGRRLTQFLTGNPQAGYTSIGLLDDAAAGPTILGSTSQFARLAETKFIETLFVTVPLDRDTMTDVVSDASRHGVSVKLVLDMPRRPGRKVRRDCLYDNFAVLDIYDCHFQELKIAVKRCMDVLGASIGLVILSPVLALIALAIKLDSSGPVVYRSLRVGKKGYKFPFYKFRTMVDNAERIKDQLREHNEREGLLFKIADDPRITPIGRWLRKYSLDELLQLWNVVRGDMSLVGPRPPSLDEFDRYQLQHLFRVGVTPGLTGLWQVMARKDPSFERYLALDRDYILNWSLGLDLKILLKTAPAVIRGDGQ